MEWEDVKLGMKVVPHAKTAQGRVRGLDRSGVWHNAIGKGQPFLYVTEVIPNASYREVGLSDNPNELGGDYFLPKDFNPYIEPNEHPKE